MQELDAGHAVLNTPTFREPSTLLCDASFTRAAGAALCPRAQLGHPHCPHSLLVPSSWWSVREKQRIFFLSFELFSLQGLDVSLAGTKVRAVEMGR